MNRDLDLALKKKKSRLHQYIKVTDVDYADDLAILTDRPTYFTTLLHRQEEE